MTVTKPALPLLLAVVASLVLAAAAPAGVNITDEDDRGYLAELRHNDRYPLLEALTDAEARAMRLSTGYCICPHNGILSCGLVVSNQLIATDAHFLTYYPDDHVRLTAAETSRCYFQNKADPQTKYYFDWSARAYRLGADDPGTNRRGDYAFLKLLKPVKDAVGYPLYRGPLPETQKDRPLPAIVVSATEEDMQDNATEPVVRECMLHERRGEGRWIYTDCDISDYGCGAFVLLRDEQGRLAVSGLMEAWAREEFAHRPYNTDPKTPGSWSAALSLDNILATDAAMRTLLEQAEAEALH